MELGDKNVKMTRINMFRNFKGRKQKDIRNDTDG